MPIIKTNGKLLFFAHVPKSGGTSVENYLTDRFGEVSFLSRRYRHTPESRRWSKTSPQHIGQDDLSMMFHESFFDAIFCVVRHPAKRIFSAFVNNRNAGRIPWHLDFYRFCKRIEKYRKRNPFYLDNHFTPAHALCPESSNVFRVEDGLEHLEYWLDQVSNTKSHLKIGRENTTSDKKRASPRKPKYIGRFLPEPPQAVLEERTLHIVYQAYREDYERFGYDITPPDPA